MYRKPSAWHPASDQYGQPSWTGAPLARPVSDTLTDGQHPALADMGSIGRIPPTLFTWGRILSHHSATRGAKGWHDSCSPAEVICMTGSWLQHQVSLEAHQNRGFANDAVFAVGNWVSFHVATSLLIFPTASIKPWFITCCQLHYSSIQKCIESPVPDKVYKLTQIIVYVKQMVISTSSGKKNRKTLFIKHLNSSAILRL